MAFQAPTVTDPLDFSKTTLPQLGEMDSLLRCNICKEYYTSPVLTSCGHSFCSLCIRRYIGVMAKCALCGQELRESGLRRNVVLEEVVQQWSGVRSDLLNQLPSTDRTKGSDSSKENSSVQELEIIDLDDDNEPEHDYKDVVIIKEKKRKGTGLDSLIKKKSKSEQKKEDLAECPICFKSFPVQILQGSHIDQCLANPRPITPKPQHQEQKPTVSSPLVSRLKQPTPPPSREYVKAPEIPKLPKLDLNSLSTSALKQKLTSLQLPTTGSRQQLDARYTEYVTLWNANSDSSKPKDARLLRWELAKWEHLVEQQLQKEKEREEKDKNKNKKHTETSEEKEAWRELIKKAKETSKRKKKDGETQSETKPDTPKEPIINSNGGGTTMEGDKMLQNRDNSEELKILEEDDDHFFEWT